MGDRGEIINKMKLGILTKFILKGKGKIRNRTVDSSNTSPDFFRDPDLFGTSREQRTGTLSKGCAS